MGNVGALAKEALGIDQAPKAPLGPKNRYVNKDFDQRIFAVTPGGPDEKETLLMSVADLRRRLSKEAQQRLDAQDSVPDGSVLQLHPPGLLVYSDQHVPEQNKKRGQIWVAQLGVEQMKTRFEPDLYEKFFAVDCHNISQIHRDILRTFPHHDFFRDSMPRNEALFRIVTAYSLYDAEVGYTQGMAFIAGYLYMHMSEINAFFSMIALMYPKRHNLRELFRQNDTFTLCLTEFDYQFRRLLPALHEHFQTQGVSISLFVPQWFLTVFLYRIPPNSPDAIPKIWDRFVEHGTVALYQISLAILEYYQEPLLGLAYEDLIRFFNPLEALPPAILERSTTILTFFDFKHVPAVFC